MTVKTTSEYLIENSEKYANKPAVSSKNDDGEWDTTTWSDFFKQTMDVAKALTAMGFVKNDKLSIYSYNRKEWYMAYAAANFCNGAAVGVYHTCSPNEVEWVVGNSDSKFVFVGHNPMHGGDTGKMCSYRLHEAMDSLEKVEVVVVMDGIDMPDHPKAMSWSDFISKGKKVKDSQIQSSIAGINPEDTATLIYTSGTTGNPKGVELTYDNFEYEIGKVLEIQGYNQGEKYVSWLPCAHVFGQLVDNHAWIREAMHMHVVDNPLHAIDYCKEVQPHLFIGVPRIYEKVYSNLKSTLDSKAILRIGLKIPGVKKVFQKIVKKKIGMSNCVYAITGAAPINPDILELFHKIGIPLFEGYGMTENTAGASMNYVGNNKISSVGKAFPGTEIKVAEDGEILIKGEHVMKGYYNNSDATTETIKDDWLYTGDVGKIDADGYLYITGRKKEIYVSSAGKNIAPLVIEETMKSIPIVSQCFLVGDGRKYCSALFTLDVGVILRDKIGLDSNAIPKDPLKQISLLNENGHQLSDFTDSEEVRSEMQNEVDRLNLQFSTPEQLKKFSILPRDLTIDNGELTPTLKIRRKQINENWSDVIDSMYDN